MPVVKRGFDRQSRREFIAAMLLAAGLGAAAASNVRAQSDADNEPLINSSDPAEPMFHGARIVGCTPGRQFLFKIAYTGQDPVTVSSENLPPGLIVSKTGLITGTLPAAGEHIVSLTAVNSLGRATRKLKIVAGKHKLALTPPMGWNSWNSFATHVTAEDVRQAADAFISKGLAAKGYTYVNVDDTWEGPRDAAGNITANQKFGDMKSLADYVHSKGLKFGLYSSPGPTTCAKYPGSYQHELQDAQTYASWGVDYLKYDYCSYSHITPKNSSPDKLMFPYGVMRHALDQTDRDILYSLCQYGLGDSWKWAAGDPVYGNAWRICGDIRDNWKSMTRNGFKSNLDLWKFAGPGHWNDPDMLVVGRLGWGKLRPTNLTPWEQVTHITLWCMQAAPLLIGCDMSTLDPFTISLLTNTEVLDVNQDPLGFQAAPVKVDTDMLTQIWAKPLWDGTYAVALFNLGPGSSAITVSFADDLLHVAQKSNPTNGSLKVRDLWQRKDLDETKIFTAQVPSHGAIMLKVGSPQYADW
ncbi:MAG TPA: glycoside hydrolase family 27 protein [Phycisphaerae bacterium]|nr:glycoside hydrolase family 27 protein [Phycisphaerae bacterium]